MRSSAACKLKDKVRWKPDPMLTPAKARGSWPLRQRVELHADPLDSRLRYRRDPKQHDPDQSTAFDLDSYTRNRLDCPYILHVPL